MGVEKEVLSFECQAEECEGNIELNLHMPKEFDAWSICGGCGKAYLAEQSGSNRRMIAESGEIVDIDPDNALIKMVVSEQLALEEVLNWKQKRMEARNENLESVCSKAANISGYSEKVPVPDEVFEMAGELSAELKLIKITLDNSDIVTERLANYFGEEVEKVIAEGVERPN